MKVGNSLSENQATLQHVDADWTGDLETRRFLSESCSTFAKHSQILPAISVSGKTVQTNTSCKYKSVLIIYRFLLISES